METLYGFLIAQGLIVAFLIGYFLGRHEESKNK